jgi:hypothetical protein
MAKYIMVYKSGAVVDWDGMPKEQLTLMMEAFGEWIGSMGSAVIDRGDPVRAGKTVGGDGVSTADALVSGYSIVEAKDFDEALSLAKSSPIIANGGRVEVYEAFAA